jgi:3',5'-nucleoside bisphosphate phosphatase
MNSMRYRYRAMTSAYDLHAHTHHSDGMLSPTGLVARAHANGVATLALTDHDVTSGLEEAQAAAAVAGVRLIPGVEISVTWQRQTIHVVGLRIDADDVQLQRGLERLRATRWWRAEEIGRRLGKKNIPEALARTRPLLGGAVVSRTHFARFLAAHGYVRSESQAFKDYLGRGRAAHVPGEWARLEEAVGWIRGAGGIAVVAHPSRYALTSGKLKRLLGEFRECGGAAIEVATGSQAASDAEHLPRLAVDFGFLASCGSDYHGPAKPWVDLGRLPPLAPGVTPVWSAFDSR